MYSILFHRLRKLVWGNLTGRQPATIRSSHTAQYTLSTFLLKHCSMLCKAYTPKMCSKNGVIHDNFYTVAALLKIRTNTG